MVDLEAVAIITAGISYGAAADSRILCTAEGGLTSKPHSIMQH